MAATPSEPFLMIGQGRRTRRSEEKLPQIDALIAGAQAVKQWLQAARSCDCESVDVCGLFVDPTLVPPGAVAMVPGGVDSPRPGSGNPVTSRS